MRKNRLQPTSAITIPVEDVHNRLDEIINTDPVRVLKSKPVGGLVHILTNLKTSLYDSSLNRSVWVESENEADYATWLEFDSEVIFYNAQPVNLMFVDRSKARTIVPDFFILKSSGAYEFIEVKSAFYMDVPYDREEMMRLCKLFEQSGCTLKVICPDRVLDKRIINSLYRVKTLVKKAPELIIEQAKKYSLPGERCLDEVFRSEQAGSAGAALITREAFLIKKGGIWKIARQ